MKVYCFYLHRPGNLKKYYGVVSKEIHKSDNMEYCLYAYTDRKDFAELFEKSRREDLFFKKVLRMSKSEYKDFEYDFGEHQLFDYTYRTNLCVNGIYKLGNIRILSTGIEYDTVSLGGNQFFDELLGKIPEYIRIFRRGIIKEEYAKSIELLCDIETFLPFIQGPQEDLPFFPFNLNQMEIFRELFSNTFKESGVYKYAML